MIKLKKIVAVASAMTMIMGLGMTASAAAMEKLPSPYYGSTGVDGLGNQNPVSYTKAEDAMDNNVTKDVELADLDVTTPGSTNKDSVETIDTDKELAAVLATQNVQIPKDATVTPIYAADINGLPKGTTTLVFTVDPADFTKDQSDAAKYRPGQEVYALVETGTGTGVWELKTTTVTNDGTIEFDVDHTGMIVLFKVMKDGKMAKLEKKPDGSSNVTIVDPTNPTQPVTNPNGSSSTNAAAGQNTSGTTTNSTSTTGAVSPKTGEF